MVKELMGSFRVTESGTTTAGCCTVTKWMFLSQLGGYGYLRQGSLNTARRVFEGRVSEQGHSLHCFPFPASSFSIRIRDCAKDRQGEVQQCWHCIFGPYYFLMCNIYSIEFGWKIQLIRIQNWKQNAVDFSDLINCKFSDLVWILWISSKNPFQCWKQHLTNIEKDFGN